MSETITFVNSLETIAFCAFMGWFFAREWLRRRIHGDDD
jgi:hypothetical protein